MRRVLLGAGLGVLLLAGGAAAFVSTKGPDLQPARAEPIEATPARVARGEYLANHVMGCFGCHSERDWGRYGAPIIAATKGAGIEQCMTEEMGVPGRVCFPNITPDAKTGLGTWSDGEILRAIREGVDRDGKTLFPMMPYKYYRELSDEDAYCLVAYLRTLKPVERAVPETEIDFPVSFFIQFEPKPVTEPVSGPDAKDRVAQGHYLALIGGCKSCHTPVDDKEQSLPGMDYAGGRRMLGIWGTVSTPNLTPHEKTGMKYDEPQFGALFKAYEKPEMWRVVDTGQNTPMPWIEDSGMSEADLGSIHAYLRSVKAIDNAVQVR